MGHGHDDEIGFGQEVIQIAGAMTFHVWGVVLPALVYADDAHTELVAEACSLMADSAHTYDEGARLA